MTYGLKTQSNGITGPYFMFFAHCSWSIVPTFDGCRYVVTATEIRTCEKFEKSFNDEKK